MIIKLQSFPVQAFQTTTDYYVWGYPTHHHDRKHMLNYSYLPTSNEIYFVSYWFLFNENQFEGLYFKRIEKKGC